jgi:hypothetical protein
MKIDFSLSSSSQLILRILHGSGCEIPAKDLETVFYYTSPMQDNFSEAIDVYSNNFKGVDPQKLSSTISHDIDGLGFIGLVEKQSRKLKRNKPPVNFYVLTDEGKRIAQAISENRQTLFRPKIAHQNTVFIACAFGRPDIDDLCGRHLLPASARLGYKPIRIDKSEPDRTITELMIREITQAAAVLADLTYARQSVYFEVGYAQGLGIPLILSCRKDHMNSKRDEQRVHFDLQQYKISYWTTGDDGNFVWENELMEPEKRLAALLPPRG